MVNCTSGIVLGLYARRRNKFRQDFTYNKFHFGAFIQIASALGMAACRKMPNPMLTGPLFVLSIGLTSLPAYQEGFREIRNQPDLEYDTSIVRRIGLYCFLGGYVLLFI